MNQTQLAADLAALNTQVTKIGGETRTLIQKVTDLTTVLEAGAVSPEVEAALDALKTQVAVVDDLVADPAADPAG